MNYFTFSLSICCLLFTTNLQINAQTDTDTIIGKIIYETLLDEERLQQANDSLKKNKPEVWAMVGDEIIESMRMSGAFKYQLLFNQKTSHFSHIDELGGGNDGLAYKTALITGKGYSTFFLDHPNQSRIEQRKSGLDKSITHIIKPYEQYDWKLTGQTKKVGNYLCKEATTTYSKYGRDSIMQYVAIAWFTEDLPFSFGPMGFDGLPGLILELYPIKGNNNGYRAMTINIPINASQKKFPKLDKATDTLEEKQFHEKYSRYVKELPGRH
ncbi:MAG: GLPGLI family protein [Bacteroidota bacterium]